MYYDKNTFLALGIFILNLLIFRLILKDCLLSLLCIIKKEGLHTQSQALLNHFSIQSCWCLCFSIKYCSPHHQSIGNTAFPKRRVHCCLWIVLFFFSNCWRWPVLMPHLSYSCCECQWKVSDKFTQAPATTAMSQLRPGLWQLSVALDFRDTKAWNNLHHKTGEK